MGKRRMEKTPKRILEEHVSKVWEALDEGFVTRRDILKYTKIKAFILNRVFKYDPDLYEAYSERRKGLVDTAADNLQDIIDDKEHPSHFAASKYVLQSYKSDLDTILDKQDKDGDVVIKGGRSIASPVTIKFTGSKEESK